MRDAPPDKTIAWNSAHAPIIQSTRKLSSICANSILLRAWRPICNFRRHAAWHHTSHPPLLQITDAHSNQFTGPHNNRTTSRAHQSHARLSHRLIACTVTTTASPLSLLKIVCTQYTASLRIQTSDSTRLCLCLQSPSEKSDARNQYSGWVSLNISHCF